jgi:hypothetical protein
MQIQTQPLLQAASDWLSKFVQPSFGVELLVIACAL